MKKRGWGFDTKELDKRVRPQDDFFNYVSGRWIERNPIPQHEASWGSFYVLRYETEKKLYAIVSTLARIGHLKAGSPEQMVRDVYRSASDTKRRNALGMKPLLPWLDRIKKITDTRSLIAAIAELQKIGIGNPWIVDVDQDMKNSERYILYVGQGGLGLPDRDYYLKDEPEFLRVRNAYTVHIEALLTLSGKTPAEALRGREAIMRIETALAKASMTKEDLRDPDKIYHKMSRHAFARLMSGVDIDPWFKSIGIRDIRNLIVMQPKFFKAIAVMLSYEPIEDWKAYLSWSLISSTSNALSEKFEKQNFAFYGTVLAGVTKMKPRWRRSLAAVNGLVGEQLGRLYIKKHFGPEAKKKIVMLVKDITKAYEHRIRNLAWMSAKTRKKAIKKLHKINLKLGYPDTWRTYRGLVIKPDDYFGNVVRATAFERRRMLSRLKKPVDRKEWFMNPQTVNAYYAPGMNDIVFPAAILQPPFFSTEADDALNYGSIGSVIAHEITHGFDDSGSKFDGNGNRKNWWTKEDRARFEKKTKTLAKQFNEYTVADGIRVNGELTLGENIADLGGISIAYDAYQRRLEKTGRKTLDGFTPEQRFFIGFVLFDREKRRPEAEKMLALSDPHSPSIYRINGPASNLLEFYAAFDVKKGDKLYREPKDRARIW